MSAPSTPQTVRSLSQEGYKYGFVTDIEADAAPPGLNEDTVRFISAKKDEPEWLLEWRLKAFRAWQKMAEPHWAKLKLAPIDYQAATYYAAPKARSRAESLDEVDPELLRDLREARHPAAGARGWLRRASRWTRCSTASRWRRRSRRQLASSA